MGWRCHQHVLPFHLALKSPLCTFLASPLSSHCLGHCVSFSLCPQTWTINPSNISSCSKFGRWPQRPQVTALSLEPRWGLGVCRWLTVGRQCCMSGETRGWEVAVLAEGHSGPPWGWQGWGLGGAAVEGLDAWYRPVCSRDLCAQQDGGAERGQV